MVVHLLLLEAAVIIYLPLKNLILSFTEQISKAARTLSGAK